MPTVDRGTRDKKRKRSAWIERRTAVAAASGKEHDGRYSAPPLPWSSSSVLQARNDPMYCDLRSGLRLEVVREQGEHASSNEMFASRVEDEFALTWRQPAQSGPASGANDAFFRHCGHGPDGNSLFPSFSWSFPP